MADWRIHEGDCRDVLRTMPAQSVHTVVTSPPYFGLRDYGTGEWEGGDPACDHLGAPHRTQAGFNERYFGREKTKGWENKQADLREPFRAVCGKCGARRVDRQIGLEPTPDEFVAALVEVFREVWRVLRDDGTVWLNLGDSYAGSWGNQGADYKAKDLLGVPWMVAFALRADGWYLRSDIIWSKPNPMPESVTDRVTKSHEYVFLLSKRATYHYDADAIREDNSPTRPDRIGLVKTSSAKNLETRDAGGNGQNPESAVAYGEGGRNKRSVWTVATQPYAGAHFATFPPKLIEPCILAGAPERCCGECGAPWVRVVERQNGKSWHDHSNDDGIGQRQVKMGQASWDAHIPPRTVGFEPSCQHYKWSCSTCGEVAGYLNGTTNERLCMRHVEPVLCEPEGSTSPGVVLDPFAGAGTTGLVALQHGREFVGIELSPEYARMARERIETAVRLGFRSPQNGSAQIDGQLDIFGAMP